MITSPVSVRVKVRTLKRALDFYGGTLQFQPSDPSAKPKRGARSFEIARGPALLHLTLDGGNTQQTIYFEVEDVARIHAELSEAGAKPSPVTRINWIKIAMFEIRDPDGNSLWFGKSFAEPDCDHTRPAGPGPYLDKTLPELPVRDVTKSVVHFRDVLGFKINHAQEDLGVMDRDGITVLLIPRSTEHQGIGSTYVYVENVDELHRELLSKGAYVQGSPVSHPWGLRDFTTLDLDGNRLRFGQTFE
jgi:catechol 2,3-dioxygenase-like lactoylglutathione lyase family enzyme